MKWFFFFWHSLGVSNQQCKKKDKAMEVGHDSWLKQLCGVVLRRGRERPLLQLHSCRIYAGPQRLSVQICIAGIFFFFNFWLPYKKNFFAPEWTSANGIWQVNTSLLLFVSFVSVSLSTQVPLVGWQVILHWWLSPLLKRTCLWNLFPSSSFRSFSWPTSHLTLPLIQFPFFLFTHNCICILLS